MTITTGVVDLLDDLFDSHARRPVGRVVEGTVLLEASPLPDGACLEGGVAVFAYFGLVTVEAHAECLVGGSGVL